MPTSENLILTDSEQLNEYLKECDWDSAAFFEALAKPVCAATEMGSEHPEHAKTKKVVWQQALAMCFNESKDHNEDKFDDAVEAATKAIATADATDKNTARCVRAYAYYLNGNYEQAAAECKRIIEPERKKTEKMEAVSPQAESFARELLVLVYNKLDDPEKVNESCRKLFKKCFTPLESKCFPASPMLMDAYRESVKRLNRR